MYPLSKTAVVLITRLVLKEDRAEMLEAFEREARAAGSTQIGANHVLQVVLRDRYYDRLGEGLQGGCGAGRSDVPRDVESEWQHVLDAVLDSEPPSLWRDAD